MKKHIQSTKKKNAAVTPLAIADGFPKRRSEGRHNPVETEFDFDEYIPLWLVRTQSVMRNTITPENVPSAKAIATLSKNEFRVLIVTALKGPISPSEVAEALGVDRSIVTRMINSLTRKSLIETRSSLEDLRSKILYLSDKGIRLSDEMIPVMHDFNGYLDQSITDDEKATLKRILEKLLISSLSYPHSPFTT